MNYTSFFVVLSTLGVIVFFGIFGAAWMSATEPHTKGDVVPVDPPPSPEESSSTQPSDEPSQPPTTEWTSDSPVPTRDGPEYSAASSTTQSSYTPSQEDTSWSSVSPSPTKTDPVSSKTPSSPIVNTQENTSTINITDNPVEKSEEMSSRYPEILDSRSKSSPVDPPTNSNTTSEISCTSETLTDEKGQIKIDDYTNEDSCQEWIVEYEKGFNVDITIDRLDLDGAAGDYVLISPGNDTTTDGNNPILSWKLTKPRKYKIPYDGTAYILFVTHRSSLESESKTGGFRIIYSRSGELTTTEISTTIGPIPEPVTGESIIVSIAVDNFTAQEIPFRQAVATRANEFCAQENITLNNPAIYANVYLSSLTQCLPTWPKKCITMTMAIPVDTKSSKTYELTKENLQKMWDEWNGEELEKVNISKITGPNYKKRVIMYSIICIAFVILFSLLLMFLWNWQLRNMHILEETKPRSSAEIEVPPLFGYMDSRLDDVPEYVPYFDSLYELGTETSTDDIKTYGSVPYYPRSSNFGSSTFQFGRPSSAGIDNNAFIAEEDEDEYEIMNRASLTQEANKTNNETENKTTELQGAKQESMS